MQGGMLLDFEERIILFEKELIFAVKYAAKIAATHQIAKDDVKMLREQIKELKERMKAKIDEDKKKLEEMDEVKVK